MIRKLSLTNQEPYSKQNGRAVVLVGSFAPVHDGHFDALTSAVKAVERHDTFVEAAMLVPNSDAYLTRKLGSCASEWPYSKRVKTIACRHPEHEVPTFVDDISGSQIGLGEINLAVPQTIERHLGFTALDTYFIVGSDQLLSMEAHLSGTQNRSVCVLRPGRIDEIKPYLTASWVKESLRAGRLLITTRKNMDTDISSTDCRQNQTV